MPDDYRLLAGRVIEQVVLEDNILYLYFDDASVFRIANTDSKTYAGFNIEVDLVSEDGNG